MLALFSAAAVLLLLAAPCNGAPARSAASAGHQPANGGEAEVDSEHIFGFTEGSDVGDAGEKEIELEPLGRFGKRGGSYAATSTELLLKYSLTNNFRIAPFVAVASHNISNVPGLENRDQFRFEGAGAEIRYRLLDREHAPFGLTLSASPHRGSVDETTGAPVEQYGSEFAALLDRTLIPNRLFAAVNLVYEPEWTKQRTTGEWERDSTIGIGAAITAQLVPRLFLGAELRYLRTYDGVTLNTFLGDALFLGPNVYLKLSKSWFFSAAWNVQVAGGAVGEAGPLDLTNFERHQVRLRVGASF